MHDDVDPRGFVCQPRRNGRTAGPGRADYWDEVAGEWNQRGDLSAWRSVSDAVNTELIDRWLPKASGGAVLKTDLFDELVGRVSSGALSESFGSQWPGSTSLPRSSTSSRHATHSSTPGRRHRELPFDD